MCKVKLYLLIVKLLLLMITGDFHQRYNVYLEPDLPIFFINFALVKNTHPSQWEGTGQENGESGKVGVPSQWEGTGQERGESGKAGVPSQWEGTGQESGESGKAGVPSQREGTGQESGESGLSARSEAESESLLELG
jgi:hypothetical protein